MAAGLDSIAATEFTNLLEARFNLELPSALLFDHPSVRHLSSFVSRTAPGDQVRLDLYEREALPQNFPTPTGRPGIFPIVDLHFDDCSLALPGTSRVAGLRRATLRG